MGPLFICPCPSGGLPKPTPYGRGRLVLHLEPSVAWPPERDLFNCGSSQREIHGLEGPDTLERAPLLQVRADGFNVNGRLGDAFDTADTLITERNNFELLHPGRCSGSWRADYERRRDLVVPESCSAIWVPWPSVRVKVGIIAAVQEARW